MSIKEPTEKAIQNAILQWLRLHGATASRINSGAVRATYKGKSRFVRMNDTEGCADIIACWHGRYLAIEVKRPGGRTDPVRAAKQEAFLAGVRKSGGLSLVATSIEDVANYLKKNNLWTV